jgi:hypothetical protein
MKDSINLSNYTQADKKVNSFLRRYEKQFFCPPRIHECRDARRAPECRDARRASKSALENAERPERIFKRERKKAENKPPMEQSVDP